MKLEEASRQHRLWKSIRRALFTVNIALCTVAILVTPWALLPLVLTVPAWAVAAQMSDSWAETYRYEVVKAAEKLR